MEDVSVEGLDAYWVHIDVDVQYALAIGSSEDDAIEAVDIDEMMRYNADMSKSAYKIGPKEYEQMFKHYAKWGCHGYDLNGCDYDLEKFFELKEESQSEIDRREYLEKHHMTFGFYNDVVSDKDENKS